MVLLVLLACAVLALAALSCLRYDTWRRKGVPSPRPIPLFGNCMSTLLMREPLHLTLHRLYRQFPGEPFVGFYAGPSPALMVNCADAIKHITVKDFHAFSNHTITPKPQFDPTFSQFLFCLTDDKWKDTRVRITPAFSSGRLKSMYANVQAVGQQLVQCIRDNRDQDGVLDACRTCSRYGVDVIASCAFGCDAAALREKEPSPYMKAVADVFRFGVAEGVSTMALMFAPALYRLLGLPLVHEWRATTLRALLRQASEHREREPPRQRDIFDLLLHLKRTGEVSQAMFEAQVMQMQVAGSETSATTVLFALWALARHPIVQDRLRDEVAAARAKDGGQLTYDSVHTLPYLDCVFKETLRLWPIMPFLDRAAAQDYAVPNTKLVIEKGTVVIIPAYSIMRDPDLFEDPEAFEPDRFAAENADNIKKMSWLPFGTGPRTCIGSRFADMSVKSAIANVLLNFRISMAEKTPKSDAELPLNPMAILINIAGELPLQFTPL